ncbi:MAG TPA: class I SAM-dependent methyltransferase [Aquihabitans sp.]|jgi:2-polyprenyl-3-methyl-5-hydroxy-6-metoxy-1,4-benzoquinol methylase|nr:class I SAM-dependent methyltransferase [Aquihabitans sp.]
MTAATTPQVTYVSSAVLWDAFDDRVADVVERTGATDVGELGGGANPTTSLLDRFPGRLALTVLDVSAEELAKAPDHVTKHQVDLCSAEPPVHEAFDVVFSRMLCEHVGDPEAFHRNCFEALRPGGHAVHFFPTATALPFVLNRVIPERVGERVLEAVHPDRHQDGNHGKFPARYRWCWGPTDQQLARYSSVGFEPVSYEVGLGHHYYDRVPGVRALERRKTALALRHPSPWLAAYALVVLRKPARP